MKGLDELDYSTMLTLTRAGITTIEQLRKVVAELKELIREHEEDG